MSIASWIATDGMSSSQLDESETAPGDDDDTHMGALHSLARESGAGSKRRKKATEPALAGAKRGRKLSGAVPEPEETEITYVEAVWERPKSAKESKKAASTSASAAIKSQSNNKSHAKPQAQSHAAAAAAAAPAQAPIATAMGPPSSRLGVESSASANKTLTLTGVESSASANKKLHAMRYVRSFAAEHFDVAKGRAVMLGMRANFEDSVKGRDAKEVAEKTARNVKRGGEAR